MKNTLRKIGAVLMGIMIFTGILTSCGTSEDTAAVPTSLTITDHFGRVVTIENTNPQRIVSLAPSNTEILFALGLGDRIVGVTDYCNYPPEATTKSSVGDYTEPNIEVIVSMEPDLVLATEEHETEMAQLETHGITVVGLCPATIDEVLASITLVGQLTGQETEAATLVDDMQVRIKTITDKTSTLSEAEKTRVFYIIWHDPMWTAGAGSFANALIELAGGVNIASDLSGYADISIEAVIVGNPQVIIAGVGMGTGEDLPLEYMKTESSLEVLDARKTGRIYGVNMDIVGRPGPRIVEALEEFFKLIHPELAD
ncbi:MAG: cobalamin-binding protein [Dehalococcoidales bacterium]|nr:cobalamin-binding protein [Dehalococcoidales bacterium]